MAKFTDTITIHVQAGKGGPGAVSFRREKFVPKGGPDGGDGGRGGDVLLSADRRYYNLSHYFPNKTYKAGNGDHGNGNNMHGRDGDPLIIPVPPGTQVIDFSSGDLIADLIDEQVPYTIASGGMGGKGNTFFKSPTNQTPRHSQPGLPGEEKKITLNLKLIADIGLVGLPNAGKSTLLSKLTNAKPKIASYPFTTLIPNLGIVERDNFSYSIADIPGIIDGAHKGLGLGLSFLQHIERVRIILYLIDSTEADSAYNLQLLRSEIGSYNEKLLQKESYIVLTKIDLVSMEQIEEKKSMLRAGDLAVVAVSAIEGTNLAELTSLLDEKMEKSHAP